MRLLQNEKNDKKTGKFGENSHIGGRGGGVDEVSPRGKNSHIFPFFILISFVKSFKVFFSLLLPGYFSLAPFFNFPPCRLCL